MRSRWPSAIPAGILTVSFRSLRRAPLTLARGARFRDDAARALAAAARARDGEKSLLESLLSPALALRARRRALPGAAPEPWHVSHVSRRGNIDGRLDAFGGFLERDLEVVAQVASALGTASPAAAEEVSEDAAEDVFEAGERRGIEAAAPACDDTPACPNRS